METEVIFASSTLGQMPVTRLIYDRIIIETCLNYFMFVIGVMCEIDDKILT